MSTQTYEIGTNVTYVLADGEERTGTIVDHAKGWFTIEEYLGEDEHKVRAKQITGVVEGDEDEPEEEDEETTGGTMSKKLRRYAQNYVKATRTKGGKTQTTKHCGDEVATALLKIDLQTAYQAAAAFAGAPIETLKQKYAHLNLGQQRMNLGNRIRGAIKRLAEESTEDANKVRAALVAFCNQNETKAALRPPVPRETKENKHGHTHLRTRRNHRVH